MTAEQIQYPDDLYATSEDGKTQAPQPIPSTRKATSVKSAVKAPVTAKAPAAMPEAEAVDVELRSWLTPKPTNDR